MLKNDFNQEMVQDMLSDALFADEFGQELKDAFVLLGQKCDKVKADLMQRH